MSDMKKALSLNDLLTYGSSKSYEDILKLIDVKSEPNLVEFNYLIKMNQWETNSKLSCEAEHQLPKKNDKSDESDSSSIPSITEHWTNIVNHMNEESLIENQVVPESEFYESAHEMPNGKSALDITADEKSDWMDKVSDESFIRMEELVKSPEVKKHPIEEKYYSATDSEPSTFFDAKSSLKDSSSEANHQISGSSSILESKFFTDSVGSSLSDKFASAYSKYTDGSNLALLIDAPTGTSKTKEEEFDDSLEKSKKNTNDSPLLTSELSHEFNESVKFNDTLEEMDYLIKYGMDFMSSKPKEKEIIDKSIKTENFVDTTKCLTPLPYVHPSTHFTPKVLQKDNQYYSKPSPSAAYLKPRNVLSPFKTPNKVTPKSAGKFANYKTSPNLQAQKMTPSKYDNILSPVQYYIKNSPTVPIIKNFSPGKNHWQKEPEKYSVQKDFVAESKGKENTPLQQKAYKASATVKMTNLPPVQRLPKNLKVGIMAESLPKPTVIRHERREKSTAYIRNQPLSSRLASHSSHGVEDSFANMTVATGDISLCVGKAATRSRTLK